MVKRKNIIFLIFLGYIVTMGGLAAQNKQKTEVGYAQMIPATNNGKYQALHKTAPIGTVITVKNTFNNTSVQVKVIGQLPNTGGNDRVIIKLSEQAFRHLNPGGDKNKSFGVEISYVVF